MTKTIFAATVLLCSLASQARADTQCTAFSWAQSGDSHKAAMLVRAQVGDDSQWLQLDTGSDVSFLYRHPNLERHERPTLPVTLVGNDSDPASGAIDLGPQTFVHRGDITPGRAEGVLGLDALLGRILVIDYPNRTLCQLPASHLEAQAGKWLPLPSRIRSGKVFLFTRVGGDFEWGYFFDTGASLYHLLVDKKDWRQLTGRRGDEADNLYLEGHSWGQPVNTVGAPATTAITLGNFPLSPDGDGTLVHYIRQQPDRFDRYPVRARGLIGNAPFYNEVVLLDLRRDRDVFALYRPQR